MEVSTYTLIVPVSLGSDFYSNCQCCNNPCCNNPCCNALECYSGNKSLGKIAIGVQGSGAWTSGTLDGTIKTYDYRQLYEVFNLKDSESAGVWFAKYQKIKSHDEIKEVSKLGYEVDMDYVLNFKLQGNDRQITSVFITYEVIRLVVDGVIKDYVVTNPNSASPKNEDGSDYPGGFKAV